VKGVSVSLLLHASRCENMTSIAPLLFIHTAPLDAPFYAPVFDNGPFICFECGDIFRRYPQKSPGKQPAR
jgi:hypothetical protein